MKIKVCGMRNSNNISELVKLAPDFIGFIFYEKSKRFVIDFPKVKIPKSIKKVGVFVNESIESILKIVLENELDIVQLHGDESAEFCKKLKRHPELVSGSHNEKNDEMLKRVQHDEVQIIKAFAIDENFDFNITKAYEPYCDLFLFDTKGKGYGGTGIKYDWSVLNNYKGETPFLLSGGITDNDADLVNEFKHPKCIGIDLNSGFEEAPALKNIKKLIAFKSKLNV